MALADGWKRWIFVAVVGLDVLAPLAHAQQAPSPLIWRQHKIIPSNNELCQASCNTDEVCRAWARAGDQCVNFAVPISGVPGAGYQGWGLRTTPVPQASDIDARRTAWASLPKGARQNFVYHGMDMDAVALGPQQGEAECSAICRNDVNCKSWTLFRAKPEDTWACWTKFALGPSGEDARTISGLREATPPTAAEQQARLASLQREAAELAARPVSRYPPIWRQHSIVPATNALCQASCDTDDVCRAWSRFRDRCTNWLEPLPAARIGDFEGVGARTTRLPTAEDVAARAAEWAALPKTARPNFVHHGMDIGGITLAKNQGEAECTALCRNDPNCKSWTLFRAKPDEAWTCWTKFALGPSGEDARTISGLIDRPVPTLDAQHARAERLQREAAEVVELHRPRLVQRALSPEEQAEARALAEAYKVQPSWATLDKLWLLAESGDREAMKLVLQAGPAPKDAPFENRDPPDIAANLHTLWGALYWNTHGPDRDAARAITAAGHQTLWRYGGNARCFGQWDCGYLAVYAPTEKDSPGFKAYADTGENPPSVKFSFHQAVPATQSNRARFDALIATLNKGSRVWGGDTFFMDDYARQHGLQATLDQARANQAPAAARAEEQRNARYRDRVLAQWKALLPGGQVSASTPHHVVTQLEPLAGYLGGEYLENLAAFHSFKRSSTAEKLCAQRSRHCATQRENAAKAEMAARISARQAAGLGGTGLVTQPSGNVQVRTYDRNGNYTGTTTMSGLEAEILGVKRY